MSLGTNSNEYVNGIRFYFAGKDSYTNDSIIEEVRGHISNKISTGVKESGWKQIEGFDFFSFWWMDYEEKGIIETDSWFNFLNLLGLENEFESISNSYKTINKGLITIFNFSGNFYIVTYGNGFHYIPHNIDTRFGIDLAKKMISKDGKIKKIYQKELGGEGKQLDSIRRHLKVKNTYNPSLDFGNVTRVVNFLVGKVDVKKIFEEKGLFYFNDNGDFKIKYSFSVEGKESLYFSLNKIYDKLFLELLKKIDELKRSENIEMIEIPELIKIDDEGTIYTDIYSYIFNNFEKLFYKESLLYFSYSSFEDELLQLKIKIDTIKKISIYNSITHSGNIKIFDDGDLLQELSDWINENNIKTILGDFRNIHIDIELNDGKKFNFLINKFIDGELKYKEDMYFVFKGDLYKPNDDFYRTVNTKLNEIVNSKKTIYDNSNKEYLKSRTEIEENSKKDGKLETYYTNSNGGRKNLEALFNGNHGKNIDESKRSVKLLSEKIFCMDGGNSSSYLYNGIEICDIFNNDKKDLIHVKRGNGVKIREVFSQGKVSMLCIKNDNEVEGVIKKIKDSTGIKKLTKVSLQNEYSVVFAIYPENSKKNYTSDDIIGYFDKYKSMKYELVSTFLYLSSIGIDAKLYFIRGNSNSI